MSTIRSSYCSSSAFCCFQIMWTIFSLPTTHYVAPPSWFEYVNLLERPCIFFVVAFLLGTFESFAVVGIKCFLLHFSYLSCLWIDFLLSLLSVLCDSVTLSVHAVWIHFYCCSAVCICFEESCWQHKLCQAWICMVLEALLYLIFNG